MVIEKESVNIKVEITENLTQFSEQSWMKFRVFVADFFEKYARDLKKRMKDSMRNTQSAPWMYWNSGLGRMVHPAQPGSPPKIQTGNLARSIQWQNRRTIPELEFGVTPEAYYAKFLESGTARMKARPFFFRLIDERFVRDMLAKAYEEFIKEEANKKGTTA